MTPEERKEFNIRRYEKEKKRKADRKERNELEALLTASNDIQVRFYRNLLFKTSSTFSMTKYWSELPSRE